MARKWRPRIAATALLAWPAAALAETPPGAAPTSAPPPIVVIGAAYVAKQLCSCLFVAGRAEAPCRAEFKPQINPFSVTVSPAAVTASLGPVTERAVFSPPYGCVLAR